MTSKLSETGVITFTRLSCFYIKQDFSAYMWEKLFLQWWFELIHQLKFFCCLWIVGLVKLTRQHICLLDQNQELKADDLGQRYSRNKTVQKDQHCFRDSRLSTGLKSEFMTEQCVFKIYYQVSLLFAKKIKSSWTFSSCKVLIKD